MKIALGQINPKVGDFTGNAAKIIEFARRARSGGAELVIFSELSVCGYPPRDMVERAAFVARNLDVVEQIAAAIPEIPTICGFVSPATAESGKLVMNSAALLSGGAITFQQSKMLLPNYDIFDEQRNFAPAAKQQLFKFSDLNVGLTICEDAWNDKGFWPHRLYSVDPVEMLVREGADFIINISASPFQLGKPQVREDMLRAIAVRNRLPVIFVNQIGGNDSVVFDGSSMVLGPDGAALARAKTFEEDLIFFDTKIMKGDLHPQITERVASGYAALVLGTRDYVRKCGFSKVVMGLSGGIDSALVAAIAVDALGKENVTGVGMPGPYSSPGSLNDARELAANLGIRFDVIPITDMFNAFRKTMSGVFSGMREDLTEENMQSRIRGNILMAISNKTSALVLTTGNKSEYAVGYCTLYGDMAGALAVISDVPKTMVYQLSHFVNSRKKVIPKDSLEKPPSAELRPNQKDADSLPPYDVLDRILEDYVEDLKTVKEIACERGIDKKIVLKLVRMIEQSEYKRQQAAIGLKITEKAFGVGRRFPIAAKYEV